MLTRALSSPAKMASAALPPIPTIKCDRRCSNDCDDSSFLSSDINDTWPRAPPRRVTVAIQWDFTFCSAKECFIKSVNLPSEDSLDFVKHFRCSIFLVLRGLPASENFVEHGSIINLKIRLQKSQTFKDPFLGSEVYAY